MAYEIGEYLPSLLPNSRRRAAEGALTVFVCSCKAGAKGKV